MPPLLVSYNLHYKKLTCAICLVNLSMSGKVVFPNFPLSVPYVLTGPALCPRLHQENIRKP